MHDSGVPYIPRGHSKWNQLAHLRKWYFEMYNYFPDWSLLDDT